jgi:hypothetical protein
MITLVERHDAEAEQRQEPLGRGGGVPQCLRAQAFGFREFSLIAGGPAASGQGEGRGGGPSHPRVAGDLADQGDEAPVRAPVRAQPEGAGDPSRQAGTAGVQCPAHGCADVRPAAVHAGQRRRSPDR